LYYYRARYYHATFQRFIAQDPIGPIRSTPNLYQYVLNSPLRFGDPFGLGPGDRFPTMDDAAIDALRNAIPVQERTGREAYGSIIPTDDEKCPYTYDPPKLTGERGGPVILDENSVGMYHTHPEGELSKQLSLDDIHTARDTHLQSYIGDPKGRITTYDPFTDKMRQITPREPQRCGC
jgi:proteasome lid subunit RPN8/RPN11